MSDAQRKFQYVKDISMSQEILTFIKHIKNKSKNPIRSMRRLIEYTLAALIKLYEKDGRLLQLSTLKFAHNFLHLNANLKHDHIADLIEIYKVSILTSLNQLDMSFRKHHRGDYYEKYSLTQIFDWHIKCIKNELEILIQHSDGICLNFGTYSSLSIKRNKYHSSYSVTGTTGDNFIFLKRFSAEERADAVSLFIKELEFAMFYVYDVFNDTLYYRERMAEIKSSANIYRQLNMNIVQFPQHNEMFYSGRRIYES